MAENTPRSFVENINTLANATELASGDVIGDAQLARDDAEASAEEANVSATTAGLSEDKAQEWAVKAFNNPVETGEFSSYHWSVIALQNAGEAVIVDGTTSTTSTWSSSKISTDLGQKAELVHTHTDKEDVFTKNSAFNKSFGTSGISVDVSRADHEHISSYEPLIGAKGTAFNKDFGTNSGQVSEGPHNHDGRYMPTAYDSMYQNSAYNKDFGTTLGTVPQGNHTHLASATGHDGDDNTYAQSTTVQGAVAQLDSQLSTITISEKTKLIAGLPSGQSTTITYPLANTPVIINGNLTTGINKNALYNTNGIEIDYSKDDPLDNPGSPGTKLIEGQFDITVSIAGTVDTEYAIVLAGYDGSSWIESTSYRAIGGSTTNQAAGTIPLSLSGWLSNIYDKNATDMTGGDIYKLGVMIYSTNATDIVLTGITMSWAGQQEGALVAAGITIDHGDLTGTGAVGGVHTIADISGDATTLQGELDLRATKVVGAIANNIAILDASGDLVDSGTPFGDIATHMSLVDTPTLDNIVSMTSGGDSKDSGTKISDLALLAGNSAQTFDVGTSVSDNNAVTRLEMVTNIATVTPLDTFNTHEGLANPHNTTYTDVGAAASVHTHVTSDVTDLQDKLDSKYDEVAGAVQNNIVVFDTAGIVKDSNVAVGTLVEDVPTDGIEYHRQDGIWVDSSASTALAIGNINNPLLDLPLNNSLAMKQGVGSVTFTRASTATYVDRYGVLQSASVDEARFEKDGLLIEGASANLCLQSSTIDTTLGDWSIGINAQNNGTVSAPDGSTDAYEYESITDTGNTFVNQSITVTNTNTYTYSVWLRADNPALVGSTDKIMTLKIGANESEMTGSDLTTEWTRYDATVVADGTNATIYIGYDWLVGGKIQCWGAQLEELPFATSYIPTTTTAVTRAKEVCGISPENMPSLNKDFSVVVDVDSKHSSSTNSTIYTSGSNGHQNQMSWWSGAEDSFLGYYNGSALSTGVTNQTTTSRISMTINNTTRSIYQNGLLGSFDTVTLNTETSTPIFTLGCDSNSISQLNGHIKNFRIWDKALSPEEIKLT